LANTFTQLHIQIVFAVKGRQNLIHSKHNNTIQKYITGIVQNKGHKMLAINNMPDHFHIFIGYSPTETLSGLIRDLKSNSSNFINAKRWFLGNFSWQEGYGAFSYSHSHVDHVCKYIANQQSHHKKKTFKEEYIELLQKFDVDYKPKYLFDWVED